MNDNTEQLIMLEERKVKALEKIANVLDALTLWFEDVDKDEWSDRIQIDWSKWLSHRIFGPWVRWILGSGQEQENQSREERIFPMSSALRKYVSLLFENKPASLC